MYAYDESIYEQAFIAENAANPVWVMYYAHNSFTEGVRVLFCKVLNNWQHVALVAVLWHPALSASSSSASVTALR